MEKGKTDQPRYRVLFVDDEVNILKGLSRVLRPLGRTWDMHFATSGQEALALMQEKSFELIVSDMRMPGMDGAQLLEKVRAQSPQTVRVILSGHSEKETILKTVLHAHQFHSKPTDNENIRQLLNRVVNLISILGNPHIRGMISSIESLPSLPDFHARLMETIEADESSVEEIADLIAKDIGMASNVLKLVNSAFFGHPRPVSELMEAIWWLGLELLKALTLTVGLFSAFKGPPELEQYYEELMRHSLSTASIAKMVCTEETGDREQADLAFLGGLLHDIGKMVLAFLDPDRFLLGLNQARNEGVALSEIENQVFGASHSEVGGYFAGLWGMNLAVVEAIAFHHRPAVLRNPKTSILTAVHVANGLDHERREESGPFFEGEIDMDFLRTNGQAEDLDRWRKLIQEQNTIPDPPPC